MCWKILAGVCCNKQTWLSYQDWWWLVFVAPVMHELASDVWIVSIQFGGPQGIKERGLMWKSLIQNYSHFAQPTLIGLSSLISPPHFDCLLTVPQYLVLHKAYSFPIFRILGISIRGEYPKMTEILLSLGSLVCCICDWHLRQPRLHVAINVKIKYNNINGQL